MSNQTNGLRFDVYERVHLPDDVAAIDELEEIELVPRIQVIDQGDQAVLKGQLLLSGVYRGQNAQEGPLALEHWIPVEISLPMNRVTRLDDISIEIDNFDVDLLSARTLNITGVLSLRGIALESEETGIQQWEEESFTAVHQREAQQAEQYDFGENEETSLSAAETEYSQFQQEARVAEDEAYVEDQQAAYAGQEALYLHAGQEEQPQISSYIAESYAVEEEQSDTDEQREVTAASQQDDPEGWISSSQAYAGEEDREPIYAVQVQIQEDEPIAEPVHYAIQAEQSEPQEKKQEVHIAFAGKQAAPEEQESAFGIRTLLQSSKREQAAREAAEQVVLDQQTAAEAERTGQVEDEIEWKKLFLSKSDGDREFSKIRVCIVQKEETLEQIASRYSLSTRDLLVHNKLHESDVAEGQLLYIP